MDAPSKSYRLYQEWLDIPAEFCPPNHYALLGVDDFCDDQVVIDSAAKKRTAYLHQIAAGPHRKDIQRLLGEVAVARRTLLDGESKSQYDEWLQTPEDEVDANASAFAINVEPTPTPVAAKPTPHARSAKEQTAETRKGKTTTRKRNSTWDAYKLHLLSASVLACGVGVFAFVNRDGGRRASAVPELNERETSTGRDALKGQGLKRQTNVAPSSSSAIEQPKRKVTPPRRASGLSGPEGFDMAALTETDSTKSTTVSGGFMNPNQDGNPGRGGAIESPSTDDPTEAKQINVPSNWLDGLDQQDVFNDRFAQHFSITQAEQELLSIANETLVVRTEKSQFQNLTMAAIDQTMALGQTVAIETTMRPNINQAAALGLMIGPRKVYVFATKKGLSIRTSLRQQPGKPNYIDNLQVQTKTNTSTLALQRDPSNPKAIHWTLQVGEQGMHGTVFAELTSEPAAFSLAIIGPDEAMDDELAIKRLSIGKPNVKPYWLD